MKKILLSAIAALGFSGAFAQDGGGSSVKPTSGAVTAEMNLNLSQLGLFHASTGSPFGLNNGAGSFAVVISSLMIWQSVLA